MSDTLKYIPADEKKAVAAAQAAADATHDAILETTGSGATLCVFDDVRMAAERAYTKAGGTRKIVVRGRGNTTHPVIDTNVRILRRDCE